jgi:glycine cleavage system H protein
MTLKFTPDHEWIAEDGTVGITVYAQEQLGDVVFVDLPAVGKAVKKGDEVAVVESVKAASEIYAPVSGTISAVNEALATEPALLNSDPLGKGWIYRLTISDPAERDGLLDEAGYDAQIA